MHGSTCLCKAIPHNHSVSTTKFKVDPPKLFDGIVLDGSALESGFYQMNLYFSIETSLPLQMRVARAVLLLIEHASTWIRA